MKKQKGFTLIELIVVMVILAILAAYAIPKFYDFSTQANIASLNGLVGAISSAMVTAHAAAITTNQTLSTGQTITMEGSTVNLRFGYPAAVAAGITAAITLSSEFTTIAPTYGAGVATYRLKTNCMVQYNHATSVSTPPTIQVTATGC